MNDNSNLILPFDIMCHILSFDGRYKYRNGVLMHQISKTDDRYEMINSIPRPIQLNSYLSEEENISEPNFGSPVHNTVDEP